MTRTKRCQRFPKQALFSLRRLLDLPRETAPCSSSHFLAVCTCSSSHLLVVCTCLQQCCSCWNLHIRGWLKRIWRMNLHQRKGMGWNNLDCFHKKKWNLWSGVLFHFHCWDIHAVFKNSWIAPLQQSQARGVSGQVFARQYWRRLQSQLCAHCDFRVREWGLTS